MHSSASILDLYIALSLANFVLEVFSTVFTLFIFLVVFSACKFDFPVSL